jgi:hypothetical protein
MFMIPDPTDPALAHTGLLELSGVLILVREL